MIYKIKIIIVLDLMYNGTRFVIWEVIIMITEIFLKIFTNKWNAIHLRGLYIELLGLFILKIESFLSIRVGNSFKQCS